jgi:molecular chaperone DnaK (HSP70)
MTGRLAIDFGTSNTVLATWDSVEKNGKPFHLQEYGRLFNFNNRSISTIPSLINFDDEQKTWIGNQVLKRNLYSSPNTFRWMKRYISNRVNHCQKINGQEISPSRAGKDFLSTILIFAAQELNMVEEEIALSVPVESFEHYENWLGEVAEEAGLPRFRLIDEPSAAALGYGSHIQPNQVYLVFDFGGGTLDTSMVLMESEETAIHGKKCRVLGKAAKNIGGINIDQWIFQEVLRQNNLRDTDEAVRKISTSLLVECEKVKEVLSSQENAEFTILDPDTGDVIYANFSRQDFENILDQHNLYTDINQVLRSTLNSARERGYDETSIHAVLMVGGTSLIPSVQRTLRQFFGREKVFCDHPLDAVARGAAAFVAGVDFYDHIQHDYAIRFINPEKGEYDYYPIVKKGTPYPSDSSIAKLSIKASYDGQNQLGLAIYELSDQKQNHQKEMEIVFDPSGAARIMPITEQAKLDRIYYWMNENSPTFLIADPPAVKGEARFEVEFAIDQNKRLIISARDILKDQFTHTRYPVVKLN